MRTFWLVISYILYLDVHSLFCVIRGEPKRWYSVPGNEANAFEKVTPNLFLFFVHGMKLL